MGNWLESAWPVVCTAMMGTSCMSSTPRGGSHVQIHVVDKGVALATLLYELTFHFALVIAPQS